MKKEDIESAARILSEIKDSLDELNSALKSSNTSKATAIRARIVNLQSKIGEIL